MILEENQR